MTASPQDAPSADSLPSRNDAEPQESVPGPSDPSETLTERVEELERILDKWGKAGLDEAFHLAHATIRKSIREHDIADLRAYLARHDAAVNTMGWMPGPEAQNTARRIRIELARRATPQS